MTEERLSKDHPLPPALQMGLEHTRVLRARGIPYHLLARHLIDYMGDEYPRLGDSLFRFGHAAAWRDARAAYRHLWGDDDPDAALAVALYAVIHLDDDIEGMRKSLRASGNHGALAVVVFAELIEIG